MSVIVILFFRSRQFLMYKGRKYKKVRKNYPVQPNYNYKEMKVNGSLTNEIVYQYKNHKNQYFYVLLINS